MAKVSLSLIFTVILGIAVVIAQVQSIPFVSKETPEEFLAKAKEESPCITKDPKRLQIINDYIEKNKEFISEHDQRLINFIAGSCLPVVTIPGLYGTKLSIHITDCELLNKNHPSLAKACGYDTKCTNGFENMVWLNEDFITDDGRTCQGEILKLHFKKLNETDYEEVQTAGYRITFWGNTPKTKQNRECGFGASSNIWDKFSYFGEIFPKALLDLKNTLVATGYEIGVNLFNAPTDWRRRSNDPKNLKLVDDAVKLAFKLTGKPVIIIGHSYGAVVGLSYLYSLPEEKKKRTIARYVSVGGPLIGVTKVLKGLMMGMEEFNTKVGILGFYLVNTWMSLENQKIFMNSISMPADFLPKPFWKSQQHKPWMQALLARSHVEDHITRCVFDIFRHYKNQNIIIKLELIKNSDSIVENICINPILKFYKTELNEFAKFFPFYPPLEPGCDLREVDSITFIKGNEYNRNVWDTYCRLNIVNPYKVNTVEVKEGDKLTELKFIDYVKDIETLVKNYAIGHIDWNFYKYQFSQLEKGFEELRHPNVPATIIFSSSTSTEVAYSLKENPKERTDDNEYGSASYANVNEFVKYSGGDGTVQASSGLLPGIKWAYDYLQGDSAYPVDIVSYCSDINYNKKHRTTDPNRFITIDCLCRSQFSEPCSHASMISDKHVIKGLRDYAIDSINSLSEEALIEAIDLKKREANYSERLACQNLEHVE